MPQNTLMSSYDSVTSPAVAPLDVGQFWFRTDTQQIWASFGTSVVGDWVSLSGSVWGQITGTLSNQTDLQNALNAKEGTITAGTTGQYWRGDKSWQTLDKTAVGLSNVDNTTDLNKPISTATQTALNLKEDTANKGVANGYAPLDVTGKISSTYLPSYVNDVLEYANLAAFPVTGDAGIIYVAIDTGKTYRWSGSAYIEISAGVTDHTQLSNIGTLTHAQLETAINGKEATIAAGTTAQYWRGDKTWQTLDKTAVGLSNVDNTSDANKPISTATQTALNGKEATIAGGTTAQYWRGDKSWQTLDKTAVGLSNVDNTSDLNKPISTATQTALNLKENTANKGVANGYCPLDASVKIDTAYLPASILGALNYQTTWNATTNTPTIPAASSGNKGHYYVVSVSGSTSIDGITDWVIGDWVVSNGTAWEKVDNSDKVSSVNGAVGAVTLTTTEISEGTSQYFTEARVRASVLTGISFATSTAIVAGDSVLQAFGKAQAQIDLKATGAVSSTDNAIARFDGATGKIIQDSTAIVDDSGNVGFGSPTIAARLHVKGSGATSATKALRIDNSSNVTLFDLANNGNATIGISTGVINFSGTPIFGDSAKKSFYSKLYLIPTATNVPITLQNNVTTLTAGWNYKITLLITGTGSDTGAVYLVRQTNVTPTFTAIRVSANGDNSNHPLLSLSGTTVNIYHNHAAGYFCNVIVEGIYSGNVSITGATAFGLESVLSVFTYNVGIGQDKALARLHVRGIDSTSTNTAFKVDNSSNAEKFSVRNDGLVQFNEFVSAKTADYTVLDTEKKTLFTNTSAAGTVNFTLPTAVAGLHYKFYCNAAQSIRVTAGASGVIRRGASVTAAAGNVLTPAALGNYFEVVAIDATSWIITQSVETAAYTFT